MKSCNGSEAEKELVHIVDKLYSELYMLWYQMDTFSELFVIEKEKRERIIKNTSPGFFLFVKASLSESILMRLFRLMDPKKTGCHENLSIDMLIEKIDGEQFSEEKKTFQCMRDKFTDEKNREEYTLKDARDKLLSHNDFDRLMKKSFSRIDLGLSVNEYFLAFELVRNIWITLNRINFKLTGEKKSEPMYSCLNLRPSMVLKNLCKSIYLEEKLAVMADEEALLERDQINKYIDDGLGVDILRDLFK